jgi:predicted ATPase/DNA-binding SARP family transcriptional activator
VPGLEFRVLGAVEVWRGDEPVVPGRGVMINLLAALLVSANTVVTVERLAAVAWSGRQPQHPRSALHTKVARLRRVLGTDVIETVGDGYRLRTEKEHADLLRFDDLVTSVAGLPDMAAAVVLDEAIGLWRGTPLSNADSVVLQSEVVPGLVERYLSVCEHWAAMCLRLERPGLAAERLVPLAAAHPFRESLAAQLMLAQCRAGRPADALATYDTVRRRLREELGADPDRTLRDLHATILSAGVGDGDGGLAPAPAPAHLPPRWAGRGPYPGPLAGRDADQRSLALAVRTHRAVTLVGPAGVGKTELALHTASALAAGFAGGVAIAELGPLPAQRTDDLRAVSRVVLACANAPADPGQPGPDPGPEAMLAGLRARELLLVLDNAEHLWTACGRLVDLIARSCPGVRMMITSRRPLGLSGERVLSLDPLEPGAAAELLRRRMAEHGQDPGPTRDDPAVAGLCRMLGGLPGALELAATRLRTMSLPALAERVMVRPELLSIEGRPGLAHQRGMSDTLSWSYDLLDEPSRLLFTRLAVFPGAFSLTDVEHACAAPPLEEATVAGILAGLVDNSLVQFTGDRGYRLLVPIRAFAIGQAADRDLDATRARHLRYLRCRGLTPWPARASLPSGTGPELARRPGRHGQTPGLASAWPDATASASAA